MNPSFCIKYVIQFQIWLGQLTYFWKKGWLGPSQAGLTVIKVDVAVNQSKWLLEEAENAAAYHHSVDHHSPVLGKTIKEERKDPANKVKIKIKIQQWEKFNSVLLMLYVPMVDVLETWYTPSYDKFWK